MSTGATRLRTVLVVLLTVVAFGPALTSCATRSSPCQAAFETAAAVPADETNDDEMLQTVLACDGQEWLRQLEAHPRALGLTTVTAQDEVTAQSMLCSRVKQGESQMCDDWNAAMGNNS